MNANLVVNKNARADELMRNLKTFAAEHNGASFNRQDVANKGAWIIRYGKDGIGAKFVSSMQFGALYFDCHDTCHLAINTFYEELVWYFTEYEDCICGESI